MIKIEDALLVGAALLTLGITMEARGEVRTVTGCPRVRLRYLMGLRHRQAR